MPWGTQAAAADTISLYSRLIHLRTSHPALSVGGIRWLHAGDEVLVFVRETAEQIVLVVAARDGFDVTLPPHAIAGLPVTLSGEMVAVQTSRA